MNTGFSGFVPIVWYSKKKTKTKTKKKKTKKNKKKKKQKHTQKNSLTEVSSF
jgi:hypothetical protein